MTRSTLTDLDAVLSIARLGSFRAAALELGISTTALSNAVAKLEQRLGIRLFNRTTRSVSLPLQKTEEAFGNRIVVAPVCCINPHATTRCSSG